MSHMLRPCVPARKIRDSRRIARARTGTFGSGSPTIVQFVHGVADSGSGQEKTPTSVAMYRASNVGLPEWSTIISFTGVSGRFPLMSVQVADAPKLALIVLKTCPLPSQNRQDPKPEKVT